MILFFEILGEPANELLVVCGTSRNSFYDEGKLTYKCIALLEIIRHVSLFFSSIDDYKQAYAESKDFDSAAIDIGWLGIDIGHTRE